MLFDGSGSKSWACNEPGQVQAVRWFVWDDKSLVYILAQFAHSTAVRECADDVCTEDARRCWFVLVVEGGRAVSRMAVRNCGGAVGRAEGVRPCGTSSSFQGDETTKPEPVLDGLDCINLEWKLHESALGHGNVEQSTFEPWTAPERTGVSGHIHGAGSERLDQELDSSKTGVEFGRLCAACDLLLRRCGLGSSVGYCCGSDGARSDRNI